MDTLENLLKFPHSIAGMTFATKLPILRMLTSKRDYVAQNVFGFSPLLPGISATSAVGIVGFDSYWCAIHLPFTAMMFIALVVHAGGSLWFGYGWISWGE
jgi:hypothetical protein